LILQRQIKKYPAITAGQLSESLPELAHLANRTVQHVFQKYLKMPSRVAAFKPLLTEKMKKRRMTFCNKYNDWTGADRSTVMYSDDLCSAASGPPNPGLGGPLLQLLWQQIHGQPCQAP
jgi:hypothetical protein